MATATFTETTADASGNYLWSENANWSGGLGTGGSPADGDDVVITAGDTCTFDVDLSAYTTGIGVIDVRDGGVWRCTTVAGTYHLMLADHGYFTAPTTGGGVGYVKVGTGLGNASGTGNNGLPIDVNLTIQKIANDASSDNNTMFREDDSDASRLDVQIYDYYGLIKRGGLLYDYDHANSRLVLEKQIPALEAAIDASHDDLTMVVYGNFKNCQYKAATAYGTSGDYFTYDMNTALSGNTYTQINAGTTILGGNAQAVAFFVGSNVVLQGSGDDTSVNSVTQNASNGRYSCAVKGFTRVNGSGLPSGHSNGNIWYGPGYQIETALNDGTSNQWLSVACGSSAINGNENTNTAHTNACNCLKGHYFGHHHEYAAFAGYTRMFPAITGTSSSGFARISALVTVGDFAQGSATQYHNLKIVDARFVGVLGTALGSLFGNYQIETMKNVEIMNCPEMIDISTASDMYITPRVLEGITFTDPADGNGNEWTNDYPWSHYGHGLQGLKFIDVTVGDGTQYDYYLDNGVDPLGGSNYSTVRTLSSGLPAGGPSSAEKFEFYQGREPLYLEKSVYAQSGATLSGSAQVYLVDAMAKCPARIEIVREYDQMGLAVWDNDIDHDQVSLAVSSEVTATGSWETISASVAAPEDGKYFIRVIMCPDDDGSNFSTAQVGWASLTASGASSGGGGGTEYAAASTGTVYGSDFTLSSGQSRRFYASPGLSKGEKLEAQRKTSSGYESLGFIVRAEGKEAGIVANNTDSDQTYRVIKPVTSKSTAVNYD